VDDRDSGTASDDESARAEGDIVDMLMLHSLTAAAAAGINCCVSLWPPCVADAAIIFLPCGFFLSSSIFFLFLA